MGNIALSEAQQAAVLGHALKDPPVWEVLKGYGVNKDWFVSNSLSELWSTCNKFFVRYDKWPTTDKELTEFVTDPLNQKALIRCLDLCHTNRESQPWDVLEKKLIVWAKAYSLNQASAEVAKNYEKGEIEKAEEAWVKQSEKFEKIGLLSGLDPDRFESSAVRAREEAAARANDVAKELEYGVGFLQDTLDGIAPAEIILVGAATGGGKTELARFLSDHVARKGKRVHYFALEAEKFEIERRIKYSMLARAYRKENKAPPGSVSYRRWRKNKLEKEFGPYYSGVEKEFEEKYRTLYVYYRNRNEFGLKELEKEFLRIRNSSDLIVLDHIHYVDLDSDKENVEMLRLIKLIRDLIQSMQIPIILVAHLRKEQVRGKLIPDIHDYHGSSNLVKIVNTAIMLAPARGFICADKKAVGSPTFMRILKNRLDGSSLYHVGVTFFDTYENSYTPYYSLGRINGAETKWIPHKGEWPYWANQERLVIGANDVE